MNYNDFNAYKNKYLKNINLFINTEKEGMKTF